jgi:hypothetical protein
METSDAVEANIREKAEELEKFTEHIYKLPGHC